LKGVLGLNTKKVKMPWDRKKNGQKGTLSRGRARQITEKAPSCITKSQSTSNQYKVNGTDKEGGVGEPW